MNGRLYQRDIERLPVTGKQIRVARVGLGIKLKELAAAARVSPTTLNKIENGGNAYERTLLRLRGELERRGARFRLEGEMSWVRFPDDRGHTGNDAAHQAPARAMIGRDAPNEQRDFAALVEQMTDKAVGLSRDIATLSQKLDAFWSRTRVLLVGRIEEMENLVEGLGREYEVFLANSAETAYELACMNAFDLVLCDFALPSQRDGLWLCHQLQLDESTAKRVLMADEVIEGWDRCQQDGIIDRFLVKPVQVVDLDGLWSEEAER
jgi:CheY-like chemotaxis protein/DNA-binding XRE family transcriptional regulator